VITLVELPEEGLKVVADDAVEHPTRAAVRPCVFKLFHIARAALKWRTAPEEWRPPPCEHVGPCSPSSPCCE
jgi:hypothetical protein